MADECTGGGDACISKQGFTNADKMRLTSLTHKIIEELRARRDTAATGEAKINKLLNDRFTMGWKLDQESIKLTSLSEKHETDRREAVRQMEEKIHDYQIEASQNQVYRTTAETEKDTLKQEIGKLQLMIYSLEKKVSDYERQEKLHLTQREEHIKQVSSFQTLHKQLDTSVCELKVKHEQLDSEVCVLKDHNKRLQYQNCHQQCILNDKDSEIDTLRQELLETRIKVKVEPQKLKQVEDTLTAEINQLKYQINQLEEENEQLTTDCDSWKQTYWDGLKKLDEAHRLLNVHLHNAAQFREDHLSEVNKRKQIQEQLDVTVHDVKTLTETTKQLTQDHKQQTENWNNEREKLLTDITDSNIELKECKQHCDSTEKLLETSNQLNEELETKLTEAQTILNVEKVHEESQTELKMLKMIHCEIQVNPDTDTKDIQVEVAMETSVTQTIDAAICSTECQTDLEGRGVSKPDVDVGCQVTIATENQSIQTDVNMATNVNDMGFTEEGLKKHQSNKVVASINDNSCKVENREPIQNGSARFGYIQQKSTYDNSRQSGSLYTGRNVSDKVGPLPGTEDFDSSLLKLKYLDRTKNIDTGIDMNTESSRDIDKDIESHKEILTDVMIVISDSEEESTPKTDENSKDDEEFQNNERNDGNIENGLQNPSGDRAYNEDELRAKRTEGNFKNVSHAHAEPLKDLTTLYSHAEVSNVGLKVPSFDVKNVFDKVAVDPDEFSIAISQDQVNISGGNKPNPDTDFDENDNHSENLPEDANLRTPNSISHIEMNYTHGQMSDGHRQRNESASKVSKLKPRKHKLSKDAVDEHFSSFNMTKSMFEAASANMDEENEFQAKQPKLATKTVKKFSSIFQKPSTPTLTATVSENIPCQQIKQEVEAGVLNDQRKNLSSKHFNHPSHILYRESQFGPDTTTQPMIQSVNHRENDPVTIPSDKMDNAVQYIAYKATSTIESSGPSEVAHQAIEPSMSVDSGNEAENISNELSSEPTRTITEDTRYQSGAGLQAKTTSDSNTECEKVTTNRSDRSNKSSTMTAGLCGASNRPNESTNQVSAKAAGTSSTITQNKTKGTADFLQKYREMMAKQKTHRTSSVTQKAHGPSVVVARSSSILSDSDDTSMGQIPGGILKGVRKKKKSSRNVTWNEYVAHKEFAVNSMGSAPDDNSQENE